MNTQNPFTDIQGVKAATDINVLDTDLRIAIVGKPKVGKSWMAATAPGPVLVYDFDGRAASLAGKENVFVKTLVDESQKSPTAMKSLEADLSIFKSNKFQGKSVPRTFVFDSVTYMKKAMENEILSQSPFLGRAINLSKFGAKQLLIPQGWDAINTVRGYCEYVFNEFSRLGNVIFVFHQRDEKDRDKSTETKAAYTGRQTVDPQYLETLLALFNEVFYIDIQPYSGKYIVYTQFTDEVSAASTLLLEKEETPNISEMLEKHKLAVAAKNLNQNKG